MMSDETFKSMHEGGYFLLGIGLSAGVAIGSALSAYNPNSKNIPQTELQTGYVNPSKLELEVNDLDGDGKKEVYMEYKGKSYMLKLDTKGQPSFQAYDIKPAKIVPK